MPEIVLAACLTALVAPCVRAQPPETPTDVWIDTDPSIGLAFHDADDGFALIQAFHSSELRIRGISVSYGNTTLAKAGDIGRRMTDAYGARLGLSKRNVFAGAASAADLGKQTAATEALAGELRQGGKLTYLALGPLTNLASFIKCYPDLASRIERVIFLGGRRPGEHFRLSTRNSYEFHDANFEKDVPAAATVLDSALPLTLTPAMLSKSVLLTMPDLERIGREGGGAGRCLRNQAEPWLRLWQIVFGLKGGPVFDSMTVLAASNPEQTVPCSARAYLSASIDRVEPLAKAGTGKQAYLLAIPDSPSSTGQPQGGRQITLCLAVKPGAKRLLMDRLAGSNSAPRQQRKEASAANSATAAAR